MVSTMVRSAVIEFYHWRAETVKKWTLLLLLISALHRSSAFKCECTESECNGSPVCETEEACYVKVDHQSVSRGCVADLQGVRCGGPNLRCCRGNLCNTNSHSWRLLRTLGNGDNRASDDGSSASDGNYKTTAIISVAFSFIFLTVFLSSLFLSFAFCYCCRKRGDRGSREQHVENGLAGDTMASFGSGDMCEAIIPQGETIADLIQQASLHTSHQSSLSHLIQRAVVRHTKLPKNTTSGHFYEVHVGQWRTERVMVKVYMEKFKKFWFAESQIYQLPCMRHEGILGFIAADIQRRNGLMQHFLITEYHDRGTLLSYLKTTVIDVSDMIQLALSLADGLSHLHMECSSGAAVKPAIAHRNISSSSIYVRSDGSCCLGDMCYAIQDDTRLGAEIQSREVQNYRYLAPEYLGSSAPPKTIDSLRKADMYSYGLVLWEIARRCAIQGMVEDVILPYSEYTTCEAPAVDEMRQIVCIQQHRPSVSDQWNRDESMRLIFRTITECWHQKSAVRLTALRVRKTLEKLSASMKPHFDKNGKVILTEIDRTQFHS